MTYGKNYSDLSSEPVVHMAMSLWTMDKVLRVLRPSILAVWMRPTTAGLCGFSLGFAMCIGFLQGELTLTWCFGCGLTYHLIFLRLWFS